MAKKAAGRPRSARASGNNQNPVAKLAESYVKMLAQSLGSGGLSGDMSVAARNAGALAGPTLARASGYNSRVTNKMIQEYNRQGRKRVADEMTKNAVLTAAGGAPLVRGGAAALRAARGGSTAARAARPAAAAAKPARTVSTAKDLGARPGNPRGSGGRKLEASDVLPKRPTKAQMRQADEATRAANRSASAKRASETRRKNANIERGRQASAAARKKVEKEMKPKRQAIKATQARVQARYQGKAKP